MTCTCMKHDSLLELELGAEGILYSLCGERRTPVPAETTAGFPDHVDVALRVILFRVAVRRDPVRVRVKRFFGVVRGRSELHPQRVRAELKG